MRREERERGEGWMSGAVSCSLMVATPIMGLVLGLIKLNTYVIGANQITYIGIYVHTYVRTYKHTYFSYSPLTCSPS